MKILSLFDGMSVAQQALKDAGIPVEVYYASEIDEYAKAVTQSNFQDTIQLGSVTDIKFIDGKIITPTFHQGEWSKGNIDLMIGGSPCQDLSIAKKNREGLKGQRSGLFYEYVRIRDEVKPKYFILENVASMPKEAKEQISEILGVEPVMINASLVSAQNRKRLFWVGKWNGEKYEQVEIPQPEDRGILLKDILESDVDEKYYVHSDNWRVGANLRDVNEKSKCLNASNYKGALNDGMSLIRVDSLKHYKEKGNRQLVFLGGIRNKDWAKDGKDYSRNFGQGDRVYSPEGKSATLSALGGGRGAKTGLYAISATGDLNNRRLSIKKDEKSYCLSANPASDVTPRVIDIETTQIRKLTPTECLRLQSMPDDYFDKAEYKGKPISNTQRYKMCGNAFNKEVIVHILKHLT